MMNKLISALLLLGMLAGPARAIEAPPATELKYPIKVSDTITVLGAEFGMFTLKPDGSVDTFTPSEEIPLIEGQYFGCYLEVDVRQPGAKIVEKMTLPVPPANWVGNVKLGENAQTAIAEATLPVKKGKVARTWFNTKGDPLGEYALSGHISGVLVFKKIFKIVSPKIP